MTQIQSLCFEYCCHFSTLPSTCRDKSHICYLWLAFNVDWGKTSFFFSQPGGDEWTSRPDLQRESGPMFSLYTHQWCLPAAKRLKLRHQGLTFITWGSFVFLAVHCEKKLSIDCLRAGMGIGKHAQPPLWNASTSFNWVLTMRLKWSTFSSSFVLVF